MFDSPSGKMTDVIEIRITAPSNKIHLMYYPEPSLHVVM